MSGTNKSLAFINLEASTETPLSIPKECESEEDTFTKSWTNTAEEQLPFGKFKGNQIRKSRKMTYKRKDLSVSDKLKILQQYDKLKLDLVSQREASTKLGVPQGTLSKWLKNREELSNSLISGSFSRKRKREGKNRRVEDALLLWVKQASLKNAPVSRSILFQKANDFAAEMGTEFKATDGWLTRWKTRHGVFYKKQRGEKQDSDNSGTEAWVNIFNTDEPALCYRAEWDQITEKNNTTEQDHDEQITKLEVVETCASLNDEDITQEILKQCAENENQIQPGNVTEQLVTKKQAIDALLTLKKMLEQYGNDKKQFNLIYQLEKIVETVYTNVK